MNICVQHQKQRWGLTHYYSSVNLQDQQYYAQFAKILECIKFDRIQSMITQHSYRQFKRVKVQEQVFTGTQLFKQKPQRKQFKLDISKRHNINKQIDKSIRVSLLKKWVQIFKTLLKQHYNKFTLSEQKLIQQFYFSFGEPLEVLRRLMGFIKQKNKEGMHFLQIDDCSSIRNILLQILDSRQIINVINKSNSKQDEKLELIKGISSIRDFIINPTSIVSLVN